MPVEPQFAHLLGIPFEELLPGLLGLSGAIAYLRLRRNPWRRPDRGASPSAQ
jgi:hypothetical protein